MFRRHPYWGWLLLSALFWSITFYYFRMHRQALLPDRMAKDVNANLQNQYDQFEGFITHEDLIRRIFSDSLSEGEFGQIKKYPFYIYAYSDDSLKFWNTNAVISKNNDSCFDKPIVSNTEKGVFIKKCIRLNNQGGNKNIVVLFPVLIRYSLENEYLKSHFIASEYIPVQTGIVLADKYKSGDFAVSLDGDTPVFFLHFNQQDIQKWVPDPFFFIVFLLSLMASISWLQLMTIHHTKRNSPLAGFIIMLEIIFILRWLLYAYGLPFNLETLPFFSPTLYASNIYLSSFGDLCINTLCVLWVIVFITRHTPYKNYFDNVHNKFVRNLVALILVVGLVAYVFLFVNVIKRLVIDSNISFDVSHFYSINIYTILGLLVVGTITGMSCLIIYIYNIQFRVLIKSEFLKLSIIGFTGLCFIYFSHNINEGFYWLLTGWLLLFIIILDIRNFTLVSDLLEPHMIFWAVFICTFSTILLQYFTKTKEQERRKAFAYQKFAQDREYFMESSFDRIVVNITRDPEIKSFFKDPDAKDRKDVNQRFDEIYLPSLGKKYRTIPYLFDKNKKGLFNSDSVTYEILEREKEESAVTSDKHLFYKESILDRHYYLSHIPIYEDSNKATLLGYVYLYIDFKKQEGEKTVNLELLQPVSTADNSVYKDYAYAVYINDKLINQSNDAFPFTTYLKNDSLKAGEYEFYKINGINELYYKSENKKTIVVVHLHSDTIEVITLFSYIFGMQVFLAVIILLYQLYISYFTMGLAEGKFQGLTLRKRVHFSMLAVIMLSFIIIGTVTIIFFTNQYRGSNENKLKTTMQLAKHSIQDYLKQENGYDSNNIFDSVCRSTKFNEYLANLGTSQSIDINIFNGHADLLSASRDEIYTKGLLSKKMRPDAFYELNTSGKSIEIQVEKVAGLSYLSAYEPLRDEYGYTLGYINIPFFSSEKDLNFQLSNIVVTLINLYAFIFLLSSMITIFITRWITRTFNMISKQFAMLNLQRNERIKWPYNDEIGVLVDEYNKMVNKVEENAAMLAQSERERAWREMARQVAHEIKNPLTPMKLNIQFLQQAMRNDKPNIKEITDKVANSIVEQINNLSYIASEFSNFATMPVAKQEEIGLVDLLNKSAELYLNEAKIRVTIHTTEQELFVLSDHSQLLRVFTNLLENAQQAIPEDRQGVIEVALIEEDGNAIISVKDNGKGIPDDIAENIFQPYFTTKSSGTGLGLAMTRKIIEFWKGQIWFETVENEGTTFFIRLPLIKG